MTITYPRSIPSEMIIERIEWAQVTVGGVAGSVFTGEQQVHAFTGQWWEGQVMVAPCNSADGRVISAWLTSLKGREKTFLLGDPLGGTARGSASTTPGTPVISGASQTGNSLNCGGGPLTATGYLKEGDYVQVGATSTAKLHMVLEDVNTDGAGAFTLPIWPDLRSSPVDASALVVASPKGLFRLNDNKARWTENTVIYGFSFPAREAL